MASLPPRPASQRRPSPTSASSQHEHPGRTSSFSATSEDSQTVLLNSPRTSSQARQATKQDSDGIQKTTEVTVESSAAQADAEPRKCWICLNDETEDLDATEWRSPCPCVLVAHENCLLRWVADMEAPSDTRRAGERQGTIRCPQCKGEIRIERPRNVVIESVRFLEKMTAHCLIPGAGLFAGSVVYSSLSGIGYIQLLQIFGPEEGGELLVPLFQPPQTQEGWLAMRFFNAIRDHWRLYFGLPLVPSVLMLSRSTLADSFFPFLPLIFFVSDGKPHEDLLQLSWPPSAAMTVAALPYLRSIYNTYYERVWAPRERKWLKEIQPRAGIDSERDEIEIEIGEHDHVHDEEDGDMVEDHVELEMNFDLLGAWNNGAHADNHDAEENPPVPIGRGPAHPLNAPPEDDEPPPLVPVDDAAPAPNINLRRDQEAPGQNVRPEPRRRVERQMNVNTTSAAQSILGALIFPSVAAAVGEALKHALPKAWVTPPATGKPTGFLQNHWGRSLVGGCLFVGVKDAVMLYVRWKMAQNHRKRRVLDYDKSKGKKKTSGRA
ncbi:hypothetical protein K491DRAFT_687662 [Lophiostoma macrostomum CBS 122681]|uniref:RING-CH-type domain-containing protein n=1 Tax=Lophiostoma macrostomum CBS 122681 TaxID=1314788 RepID=A0A6A6TMY4_9PLEO|nr:hypothetical protein K491DRAFT_687662 [Lophiostoma macrostomum CBS 122681]